MNEKSDIRRIPNHPGYWAGADGKIYSSLKKNGKRPGIDTGAPVRELKTNVHDGYHLVPIQVNCASRTLKRSLLVAATFLGSKPFPSAICRHLNDDRSDDRAENLAWGSLTENKIDALRNARIAKALYLHVRREHRQLFDAFMASYVYVPRRRKPPGQFYRHRVANRNA